ncbi:platelet-derived growth factor subunit B-like [Pristis pectinata]|uniref:platelet-derived growth factor subunit B-like n=1 Tax=Pristis pectinata TaxID=685728 RepID=UPI00223D8B08|nr:platelet-derived growth factor subunit B-like [Pristis pectinata]
MNLGIALLTLWHLWPETEADWIPEHRHRSFLLHPTLDMDVKDSEDLGLSSVNEGDHERAVRVTRSTVVEAAKPAECKVRPEVMEITRSMVDPTRANFYLWPSCVEVQRCSGCCNTRNYKCQPTKVQERRVKVVKKVYRRKGTVSKTAEVVLLDHMECKCMTAAQYADSQEREGSLVSPAPTVVQARKYSSSKRKHRKFKLFGGKKGFHQT